MIVVLAVLSGVAIPKFNSYAEHATAVALAADFRVISSAGWSYYRDTGTWAPDSWFSFPPELEPYFWSSQSVLNLGTPLAKDSIYDWNGPPLVQGSGLLGNGPSFSVQPNNGVNQHRWYTARELDILGRMDILIDDGDMNTGRVQWGYYFFNMP